MTGRLEGEEKGAELRCQTTEVFLVLYYRVFTAVQMCVCQTLTVKFWAQAEIPECCMGAVWLGGIDGCLRAMEGKGMCVWAWNSCFLGLMTTFGLIYGHMWSLHTSGFVAGQAGCNDFPKHTLWQICSFVVQRATLKTGGNEMSPLSWSFPLHWEMLFWCGVGLNHDRQFSAVVENILFEDLSSHTCTHFPTGLATLTSRPLVKVTC